jgi:hypothetical protein
VNVEPVIVAAFIARENVAVTAVSRLTPVAPAAGLVPVTVGGRICAPVMKLHVVTLAIGIASADMIVVSSRAVYVAEFVSAADGVRVAVWFVALYATEAGTAPLGPVSVKLELVIVLACIGRVNVACTVVLVATPVAPLAGVVDATAGGGLVTLASTK